MYLFAAKNNRLPRLDVKIINRHWHTANHCIMCILLSDNSEFNFWAKVMLRYILILIMFMKIQRRKEGKFLVQNALKVQSQGLKSSLPETASRGVL